MPIAPQSIRITVISIAALFAMWCIPHSAMHAAEEPYAAHVLNQSNGRLTLGAGQAITVWADVQNSGTATWRNTGDHFIALNVTDPSGRTSPFRHTFWRRSDRPAILRDAVVAPGATTRVVFALQAPDEAGTYSESFQLVAENLTWIEGSRIQFSITVTPKPPAYSATVVDQSVGTVRLQPNQAVTVWADVQNTGTATWRNSGEHFVALNVTHPSGRNSAFRHIFWRFAYRPAVLQEPEVRPGETTRIAFALQAPNTEGVYSESFQLVAENLAWIGGSVITFPVIVGNEQAGSGESGPVLDVGIVHTADPEQVVANGPIVIKQGNRILSTQPANTVV